MKIFIGTDHAGFELKEHLVSFLEGLGHDVEDMGAHAYDGDDDYPDVITPVAQAVVQDDSSVGIVLGGSGQGEAMAANRVEGARAIVYYGQDEEIVRIGREHNDANILSLGARFLSQGDAEHACMLFIDTFFSEDERHVRRIEKLG